MTLCRDCKHSDHSERCHHPKICKTKVYDGALIPVHVEHARGNGNDLCGPDAKYFELRTTSRRS